MGGIGSYVSEKTQAVGGGAKTAANDPWRVARAGATSGVSEIMKADKDNKNRDRAKTDEELKRAQEQGYATSNDYIQQMGRTADDSHKVEKGRTEYYLQQRQIQDDIANQADDVYSKSLAGSEAKTQNHVTALMAQAEDQATNAQKTYTNTLQPSFKNAMETADAQAGQAMSLNDAGDMNNKVQQGVRDFYDRQASNAGRAGMQDVGMLQSLGAQANAQQMGTGAPMTGAQMQLMQASNAGQAGQAFANVQKRMQALKDQGIAQGIQQSSDQYGRGQDAVNTAANQRGAFMGAEQNNFVQGQNARGEQSNFRNVLSQSQRQQAGDIYGGTMSQYNRNLDRKGVEYNMNTGLEARRTADQQMRAQMGMNNALGRTNDQLQAIYGQQAVQNQQAAAQNQMLGAGIGAAGTIGGAIFGGPGGAMAGGAAGNAVGSGVAANMNASQQPVYQQYRQPQGVGYYTKAAV